MDLSLSNAKAIVGKWFFSLPDFSSFSHLSPPPPFKESDIFQRIKEHNTLPYLQ